MPTPSALFERQRIQTAWVDPESFATTLLLLFVDTYSTAGFQWHHETLKMEIEDDFNVTLPPANFDRLMVAIHLLQTDDFYQSAADFVTWCNILGGDRTGQSWDYADSSEVAWGVTEAMLIEPPEDKEPFSDEVRAYIGAVLDREGIIQPPDVLQLGLRNVDDLVSTVQGDFSDDPTMFAAIYDVEDGKTQAINTHVRRQLQLLNTQLEALPIQSGDTRGAVQQVLHALQPQE
jgi:hypothetical protein